jgi:hypothetical protein
MDRLAQCAPHGLGSSPQARVSFGKLAVGPDRYLADLWLAPGVSKLRLLIVVHVLVYERLGNWI